MQLVDKKEIIAINTLLAKVAQVRGEPISKDEKEGLMRAKTAGRTGSTKGLYKNEASQIIDELKGFLNPDEKSTETMRRYIIAMAHEMGWEQPGGKIDMLRLNGWIAQFGYLNKTHHTIDQYSHNELPALVSQFKKVYLSHLKGI